MFEQLLSGSTLSLLLQVMPIALITSTIHALIRLHRLSKASEAVFWERELLRYLWVCYLAALLCLTLLPANLLTALWSWLLYGYSSCDIAPPFSGGFNLVPTLYRWCVGDLLWLGPWVQAMLVGNVLMFLPMGCLLPLVSDHLTQGRMVLLACLIPLTIELLQPIVGRSFDVDDLIMNALGILLGSLVSTILCAVYRILHA